MMSEIFFFFFLFFFSFVCRCLYGGVKRKLVFIEFLVSLTVQHTSLLYSFWTAFKVSSPGKLDVGS